MVAPSGPQPSSGSQTAPTRVRPARPIGRAWRASTGSSNHSTTSGTKSKHLVGSSKGNRTKTGRTKTPTCGPHSLPTQSRPPNCPLATITGCYTISLTEAPCRRAADSSSCAAGPFRCSGTSSSRLAARRNKRRRRRRSAPIGRRRKRRAGHFKMRPIASSFKMILMKLPAKVG